MFKPIINEIDDLDLIAWLSQQTLYPKVYWEEKGIKRAALGAVAHFSQIPLSLKDCPYDVRLYGGMNFSLTKKIDSAWDDFPSTDFWLPAYEIIENILIQYVPDELPKECGTTCAVPKLIHRQDIPAFSEWKAGIERALELIAADELKKIVLARMSKLSFDGAISPWHLIAGLKEKAKNAILFCFQLTPDIAFLGATPETLFKRQGRELHTMALAGTRPLGTSEDELLNHPKEKREFAFVKEFIHSRLAHLSEELIWNSQDQILKTAHVQHIFNPLRARLKEGTTDLDLLKALHPTPALGGVPRENALKHLGELEAFERGWYGAPVGWIGNNEANMAVAIRSGLIKGSDLHLFAGTGIVNGSCPQKEWEELNHKMRLFTEMVTHE